MNITCYGYKKLGHLVRDCEINATRKNTRRIGKDNHKLIHVECYRCGEIGNIARHCTNTKQGRKLSSLDELDCYKCGDMGHIARNCKKSQQVGLKKGQQ